MKYLWTEDSGAGLHFWQLANHYLFDDELIVQSQQSNQGLLDAVRNLTPDNDDLYYLAFDIVYDNVDVVNKLLDLQELILKYPNQLMLLDITCFEYIIFSFSKLIEWTGNGHKDVISMREYILKSIKNHRIDLDNITDKRTLNYLMGFKHFSTEKVIKSMTSLLTDGDNWSIKGPLMGKCWFENCCILTSPSRRQCNLEGMSGSNKMTTLLMDNETQKVVSCIHH